MTLQFAPFNSALDSGFWHKLSQKKLNEFKLDDQPKAVNGFYYNGNMPGLPCNLHLDYNAFEEPAVVPPLSLPAHGILKLVNTIDDFKSSDKMHLLEAVGQQIWDDIATKKVLVAPTLLCRFFLLTFADLKKYHYYYWFAFPAFMQPESITQLQEPTPINDRFSPTQITQFLEEYDQTIKSLCCGYFVAYEKDSKMKLSTLQNCENLLDQGEKVLLCFCDPCTLEAYPGWPLRNLLTAAAYYWGSRMQEVEVICYRDRMRDGKRDISHSLVLKVTLPDISDQKDCPKCVGWEKNERQKMGPRMVNLSSSMDPAKLAESAVDLNLKLMRWRLLPELDLEKLTATRCLLLGAGTLGCNVARCLMGWGVRNITLVDNGTVSYSNPVRQTLFTFADSLQGGKPKAEAAAEAMKLIFPGVNAVGLSLSIPMPGHSITDSQVEQVRKDVEQLEELIDTHDVVFLLMDTRESRWLPTLLGAIKQKLVLNAALGFDTFLVLRHGLKKSTDEEAGTGASTSLPDSFKHIPGDQLGCYFCNDVVAPGDSTKDRTLDQQCTVSRPGMSMMASALAVELFASILQHPDGGEAAADTSSGDDYLHNDHESPLGLVPHQIRGFLSRYHHVLPAAKAFLNCTACSSMVMDHYKSEGFGFLLKVFNDPTFLEELTGLTALHANTEEVEIWELSDDESI